MEDKDRIIFEYDGKKYTVSKAANPIILPDSSYVLKGDGWAKEASPPNPGKLKLLFKINHISMSQEQIAKELGGVLAIEIIIKRTVTCPNGCSRATDPYCKKCGSKTEVTLKIKPADQFKKI
ncbi:MAG TPA: hypothetical protein PLI45_00465 [Candidatus Woesebacteria bacterium]|nr:hypothetical protein [Candidatus Woesebacteria bacterium]